MKNKLGVFTDWLRDSGLKINKSKLKTELCSFQKDQQTIHLTLNNQVLFRTSNMNILGVAFDCKLNWQIHIENTITKAKKKRSTQSN